MLGALAFASCLPNPSPATTLALLSRVLMSFSYLGEAHHIEDPVKLIMMVRVACLDIFLPDYIIVLNKTQSKTGLKRGGRLLTSHLQWKIGSLVRSSANMQPIAQMSIA